MNLVPPQNHPASRPPRSQPKKIVSVIPSKRLRQKVHTAIHMGRDLTIAAAVDNISAAYGAVEDHLPALVVVEEPLTRCTEFAIMRRLFVALDVRWLIVTNTPGLPVAAKSADLFALHDRASPTHILGQIEALLFHDRNLAPPASNPRFEGGPSSLLLIGASTGGVEALRAILSSFPADCPPTIIVQHTSPGFGAGLATLLNKCSAARVRSLSDEVDISQGTVLLAAGLDTHAELHPSGARSLRFLGKKAGDTHVPSVNRLFMSAVPQARHVVATVLTGMGNDGARGLAALKAAGARTFAQDAQSSVVDGMPRAAREIGAADTVLPLSEMAKGLLRACREQSALREGTHG